MLKNSFLKNPYATDSDLLLHVLLTNVLIVRCFGQKRLLNALNVNVVMQDLVLAVTRIKGQ